MNLHFIHDKDLIMRRRCSLVEFPNTTSLLTQYNGHNLDDVFIKKLIDTKYTEHCCNFHSTKTYKIDHILSNHNVIHNGRYYTPYYKISLHNNSIDTETKEYINILNEAISYIYKEALGPSYDLLAFPIKEYNNDVCYLLITGF